MGSGQFGDRDNQSMPEFTQRTLDDLDMTAVQRIAKAPRGVNPGSGPAATRPATTEQDTAPCQDTPRSHLGNRCRPFPIVL
jgi:hypothetical protein